MFIKAAALRNEMLAMDFTDNGGAIHSAERILDILGLCLNYPTLTHRNALKTFTGAERSQDADRALKRGKPVHIEHLYPHRALTIAAIEKLGSNRKGAEERLIAFVKRSYRLVLLTAEERARLDRINRSAVHPDRLAQAGIKLAKTLTAS
jgi:hypothetical protein